MLKRITLLVLVTLTVSLVGCSKVSTTGVFRDRNFDYTRSQVTILNQPLQTPKGLSQPKFSPQFTIIPVEKNSYAPEPMPNMAPPGFTQVYTLPDVKTQTKT